MNGTFQSGGARLVYRESGMGIPVIFLHPTPLDHHYWQPLVARLDGVHAIVPDLRGHGASELGVNLSLGRFARVPDAPTLSMAQLAADILALMDQLVLPEAVFAGCSIGGYVLLELWRQAPRRMRGLAFVCSKPQPDADANLDRRVATIAQARAGGSDAIFDGMAQTLIGATARSRHASVVQELRACMTLTPEALVAAQAGLAVRPDSVPTVTTVTVPILAIAGGEDPVSTPAEMETFHGAPGGCEFHLLSHAGHFAAYEHPEDIAPLFAHWLRQFGS